MSFLWEVCKKKLEHLDYIVEHLRWEWWNTSDQMEQLDEVGELNEMEHSDKFVLIFFPIRPILLSN